MDESAVPEYDHEQRLAQYLRHDFGYAGAAGPWCCSSEGPTTKCERAARAACEQPGSTEAVEQGDDRATRLLRACRSDDLREPRRAHAFGR